MVERLSPVSALVRQIDSLLALNSSGALSHGLPGLARELLEKAAAALRATQPAGGERPFHGAQCPSYPACSGGCGLGCTHEIEQARSSAGNESALNGIDTRLARESLENLNATDDGDPGGNLLFVLKKGFAALGWSQPSNAADDLVDAIEKLVGTPDVAQPTPDRVEILEAALHKIDDTTIDHVAVGIARAALRGAAQSSAASARLTELAQALVALQEDMPSADVRNCLGEAAHYLEKFAAITPGNVQPKLDPAVEKVILIARDVVWFDWSSNDTDAVHAIEQLRLALSAISSTTLFISDVAQGWRDINTAPKNGAAFLVWVPENLCIYDVVARDGNLSIFGGGFRDNLHRATLWQPLPTSPISSTTLCTPALPNNPARTPEWITGQKRIHDRERTDSVVKEMHKGGEP